MNERGGAIYGLLAAIGFVVVVMAVAFAVCVGNAGGTPRGLGAIQLVSHYDRGGYDDGGDYQGRDDDGGYEYRRGGNGSQGDCQSGGCGNRSRRCDRSSGDCRSSFSPGPFKDSPVTICLPYSCNSGGEQSGGNRQENPPDEGDPQ